jgi:hypothetical protein
MSATARLTEVLPGLASVQSWSGSLPRHLAALPIGEYAKPWPNGSDYGH